VSLTTKLIFLTLNLFQAQCSSSACFKSFHRWSAVHSRQTFVYSGLFSLSGTLTPPKAPHAQSQLTTEYTPRDRNVPPSKAPLIPSGGTSQTPSAPRESTSAAPEQSSLIEGVDLSTLPPATAPPSHPSINFDIPGVLDGLSILEVDISTMAEKPWRIPGSDISDWFNYGFDEISWEAYCYRRRDLGDLANVLKTNVLVRYIANRFNLSHSLDVLLEFCSYA
jgi:hypothetical protein